MSTTHPVNRTTEWYDLQVKYGNYDPLPEEVKSEDVSKKAQELIKTIDPLEERSLRELDELEDAVDEDVLAKYRSRRLAEMKKKQARSKFSEVLEIAAPDYVEQVTEASKADGGKQVVVCLLYKDSVPQAVALSQIIKELATRHRDVKFCQGVSDKVVPNYKDSALPALLIYRGGACERQIVGTTLFGGSRMSRDSVEWVLAKKCKVMETDLPGNPLKQEGTQRSKGTVMRLGHGDSSDSDSSGPSAAERHVVAQDRGYGDQGVDDVVTMMRKLM
eukprot:Protomagalhaensia_wolfi_Nauph_80__5781@NODE_711_length_2084_cov_23_603912_g532_i0_p2_GENE_NODE_711_length_2084_cov_23_603912_g532_i0NODE_711_length_2084_cov_23_603912_g532_i0_p2_ORF_typecomplete_len275_score49_99Phosducin/PF02114_16/7_7e42HyaE/PF07449_11/6_7e03HyaE/PF07449_11/0_18Thioredoxin/PF00085_20/0_21_NODE_711_length_2084_cov_23_603912_g532_i02071031